MTDQRRNRKAGPNDGTKLFTAEGFFRAAWERLAKDGHCDEVDGTEYRRVLDLWLKAAVGDERWVTAFIRDKANRDAQGKGNNQKGGDS